MQDRITEILAKLKGMERQGMSQGGRPTSPPFPIGIAEFDPVAGSEGGRPLTADEYTSQQVDFYDFPGIDVSVAPPADPDDDDDDDDEPLRPNILTPVSDREETSVFDAQVISSSGRPRFERLNAQQSLDRFTDKDLDINGDNRFENFIERTKAGAEKIGGGVGLVASAALGPATSGLMLAGASLNRKRQRENANAIMRSNNTGGSIFEFNGQVVSRAPGARNFDGTFANTSNEELQRLEAISMNAVPGTFFEVPKDDDSGEFQPDPTRIKNGIFKDEQSGIIVDAFGTVHSASGRLTATHGETGRTGVMRAALAAAGVPNYDFTDAQARQFIQTYRQDRPTFGTARGMDKGTYDSKLNAFGTTATTILAGMGIGKGGTTPVTTTTGNIAPKAPDGGTQPPPPPSDDGDRDDDRSTFRDSEGRRDSVTITVDNVSKAAKDYKDQYDEDDFIDESGRFTEGFGKDDSDNNNNGGGKDCCFIMLEARYGDGTMDDVVRRYRDEHMTDRNKRGYYKVAEVLVPLMRKSRLAKWLVTKTFADPLVSYGKYYYGQNKHGVIFAPVKSFWMSVFNIVGGETEFIRENGKVV
jgi:hypothetical protein